MYGFKLVRSIAALGMFSLGALSAPAQRPADATVDVAVTFSTQHSLELNTPEHFWAKGGSIEVGADAFRGLGIAAKFSGVHTSSIGNTGTPLSMVTELFGPRYRWHDGHRLSLYGEGLLGEVNGFDSIFPYASGAQGFSSALAIQTGGGLDLRLRHHLSLRAVEAAWLYTCLPNSGSNVQNNLVLGSGIVLHTGR